MAEAYLCLRKGHSAKEEIPVQFNPEKIKFSISGNTSMKKRDFQEINGKISENTREKEIFTGLQVSMRLVFDKNGEEGGSVKGDVELLQKTLESCTKDAELSFYWNELEYTGALKQLDTVYEMFDPQGTPVRASVDLTIECQDKGGLRELFKKDYQALFQ